MTSGRFRVKRLWLCFLAVCLASIATSRVFAQTAPAPVCDPSPEIKAALDSVWLDVGSAMDVLKKHLGEPKTV